MATSTAEERNRKVLELKSFVQSVEERMKIITDQLSWSYEKLCEEDQSPLAICSVHPEHRTSHSSISSHEEKCKWLQEGYHENDLPLSEYFGHGSCVFFTPDLLQQVVHQSNCGDSQSLKSENKIRSIPQTSTRFDQEFTQEEKLAIYDYVIAHTRSQKLFMNCTILPANREKSEERIMTPLEIAAAERDAKRRRASYRNKVHTNRKTHTEIMREVIQSQMEELKELSLQNEKSKEKDLQQRENESDSKCLSGKSKNLKREHSNVYSRDKTHQSELHRNFSHHSSKRNLKHKSERESRHNKHKKSKRHKRSRSRS